MKAGHKPGSVPVRRSGPGWASVWDRRYRRPRAAHLYRDGCHGQPLSLGLAPSRGLPSQHLSMLLVRSYRTLAPLPVPTGQARWAIGGVFLWHSPHGHPHWALPSKPGHWGARTFLNRSRSHQPKLISPSIATTSPAFTHDFRQRGSGLRERPMPIMSSLGAVAQPDRATVS